MKTRAFLISLWFALSGPVMAGSIGWGTSAFDELYDAYGNTLDGTYQFELGTFGSGFTPTAANTHLWAANWKLIEPGDFNVANQYVTENSILTNNGPNLRWERDETGDENRPLSTPTLFSPGEDVYVWAFNGKSINPTTQWALVTGRAAGLNTNWELSTALGEETAMTRDWRMSNANTVVFGGLNDVQGSGNFAVLPGSFTLQTALLAPIPEPDITVLLAAAAVFSLHRRRTQPASRPHL